MFAGQADMKLSTFERAVPLMKAPDWKRILSRFVTDLDAVFAKMPPCRKSFQVYRGTGHASESAASYLSTSMSRDIAKEFGRVRRITIPVGARVIPLFCVSRYDEHELLLPRGFGT